MTRDDNLSRCDAIHYRRVLLNVIPELERQSAELLKQAKALQMIVSAIEEQYELKEHKVLTED